MSTIQPTPASRDFQAEIARMSIAPTPPLVVDVDGTLLRSDLLLETALLYLRAHPLRALAPLVWLIAGGKAHLKKRLAVDSGIDVTTLPFDMDVIERIRRERAEGRRVILASASDRILADKVATHLGLFDEVLASDGTTNLTGHAKAVALVERFGEDGFDYIGNSRDDLPVWRAARHALLANPEPGVARLVGGMGKPFETIHTRPTSRRDWASALRLHQWLKNLLIFAPLLAAHRIGEPALLAHGLIAFIAFGLCASSVYLLNDLLDLADDRQHPSKRSRPFACGHLSIKAGALLSLVLLLAAFVVAFAILPRAFAAVLAAYYMVTCAYSLVLKRFMIVDVIVLAVLYSLRIVAGAAVFSIALSFWILAFSMFMFLSLALVKRYSELHRTRTQAPDAAPTYGRGYRHGDLGMIAALGGGAGYMAVLVLALYINDLDAAAIYRHPQLIWLACLLLLYWISRTWMLAQRGELHDDPVVFAITDRVSLIVGALFGLVFWAAA